jgi:hypothetical protein
VQLDGWESWHRQTAHGAVESEQRVRLHAPVVETTADGAQQLGATYWDEVERAMRRLVRRRRRDGGLELRVLGVWPVLLAFGEPELLVDGARVSCSYPIAGGVLAQRAAGRIEFVQSADGELDLRSAIRGFLPALAARAGRPHWTGALYNQVQNRIHVAISRRYFARLIRGAAR